MLLVVAARAAMALAVAVLAVVRLTLCHVLLVDSGDGRLEVAKQIGKGVGESAPSVLWGEVGARSADAQHDVACMNALGLTLTTEIVVVAHRALEPSANDAGRAGITQHTRMQHRLASLVSEALLTDALLLLLDACFTLGTVLLAEGLVAMAVCVRVFAEEALLTHLSPATVSVPATSTVMLLLCAELALLWLLL